MVDRAGVLSPGTRQSLEQSLAAFEKKTGHQIVVHTTPSLEGLPIEDYSMQVAQAWKIGQKGLDNGVILTVAPNERKLRIEVGYGLEGVLPDAVAARIIREQITPEFRAGHMEAGVVAGVRAIEAVTEGEELPLPKTRSGDLRLHPFLQVLWLVLVLLIVFGRTPLLWWLFGARALRGWGRPGGGYSGAGYRSGGFSGGGFGGGGFGGGGFSGGGGGFGGGGSSGSW
ncbi:MAG: TPM domain-containing protein [Myxococcota bacterium]